MRFTIDKDTGSQIAGWVLPDNPGTSPKLLVVTNGDVVSMIHANVMRPALRERGLHDTGICGFDINVRNVPDLESAVDVEIYDEDTGVLIYRRLSKDPINSKLFRLEFQLLRDASLNEIIEQNFHLSYMGFERLPEETAQSILRVQFSDSIYATGRVPIRKYESLLRGCGFTICAYMRDPVEELAEQLLIAQWTMGNARESMRGALPSEFLHLLDVAPPLKLQSWSDFESWLTELPEKALAPLCDPATRLLTCRSLEERREPQALADALDALGEMHVVGLKPALNEFIGLLGGTLDCDLPLPEASPHKGRVADLAEHLRETAIVQRLLSTDIQLYKSVETAYQVAMDAESSVL